MVTTLAVFITVMLSMALIVFLAVGLAVVWRLGVLEHSVIYEDILQGSLFYSEVVGNGKLEPSGDGMVVTLKDSRTHDDVVEEDSGRVIVKQD